VTEEQTSSDILQPVFLHSSFRTGSTWLWSKFRAIDKCYCYYEVFNEILSDINFSSILSSPSDWNSHHPEGPPYFTEFSPLIMPSGGVEHFDNAMALQDFFLSSDDSVRSERLRQYLMSLVNLAHANGKIPVLSCTRGIGRVHAIRNAMGGKHLLLKRRLLNQWFSYSNQLANHNSYFLRTIVETIRAPASEPFVVLLRQIVSDINVTESLSDDDHDNLLVAFLAFHIFLYLKYKSDFDIVLDFSSEISPGDLKEIEQSIEQLTGIDVSLSDYNESISAPLKLIRNPSRVYSMVHALFAKGILGMESNSLYDVVEQELCTFRRDYEQYCQVARSSHLLLDMALSRKAQLQVDLAVAVEELKDLRQASGMPAINLTVEARSVVGDVIVYLENTRKTLAEQRDMLASMAQKSDQLLERLQQSYLQADEEVRFHSINEEQNLELKGLQEPTQEAMIQTPLQGEVLNEHPQDDVAVDGHANLPLVASPSAPAESVVDASQDQVLQVEAGKSAPRRRRSKKAVSAQGEVPESLETEQPQ